MLGLERQGDFTDVPLEKHAVDLVSTTSMVFVLLPGMEFLTPRPPVRGRYVAFFSATARNTAGANYVFFGISLDGTTVLPGSQRQRLGTAFSSVGTQIQLDLDGNTPVRILWRTDGQTAEAMDRSFTLIKEP